MLGRVRVHRPSHATVVAYLALFVALGGSSYAVVRLGRNAVKTRNIAPNAVTSSKVKDRSLLGRDFAPSQLQPGPPGPKGETGPQGPPGTPDTSRFYDKAASDARFLGIGATASDAGKLGGLDPSAFLHANGTTFTNAQAAGPDFDTADVGTNNWTLWYSCPDVPDPSTAVGTIHLHNPTTATLNLFVDDGGTNPAYGTVAPGGTFNKSANAGGDKQEWDVQGFPDGRIAHIQTVSVNRPSPGFCHFQVWAIETLG